MNLYYTTKDAISDVRTIGEHQKMGPESSETYYDHLQPREKIVYKIKHLRLWIRNFGKRVNWAGLNKDAIKKVAEEELDRYLSLLNGGLSNE